MRYFWLLLLCTSCSVGTVKLLPSRPAALSPKAQINSASKPQIISMQSLAQPDLAITTPPVIFLPADVWITWDVSPSEDVIGYNVYYGWASHQYQFIESVSTNLIEITNVDIGREYWFTVTAFNTQEESDYSDELDYTIPQQLGLFFDQPGDTLWASYNLIDWFPRQAQLKNNMWRVEMQSGVPQEFYRTSTNYVIPSSGSTTNN